MTCTSTKATTGSCDGLGRTDPWRASAARAILTIVMIARTVSQFTRHSRGPLRAAEFEPTRHEPHDAGDQSERKNHAERLHEHRQEDDEIPPRLLERLAHHALAGVTDHRDRLVHCDAQRTHGGMCLEVADPTFVALDLFANLRECLFDIKDVFEFAGPRGKQADQALFESPGIVHSCLDIHKFLAHILSVHVYGLDLANRLQ